VLISDYAVKMAFRLFAYKAYKINKKLEKYEHEKENAIKIANGLPPDYTVPERFYHFWSR
jgi:hypothetical protein